MKQKVKDETFFGALDSFTSEQQGAIKRYFMMKEEEREKQQSWQNQEYVQSAIDRILIIHSRKQMNVKERWLNLKN